MNDKREIKFRQAIYVDDKFHHWHHWGFMPDLSFVGPDSVNGLAHALDNSCQFTGLCDKNGKDLNWWEGDLISLSNSSVIYEIFWNRNDGQWCARRINFISDKHDYEYLYRFAKHGYKIIGNIHTKEDK